VHADEADPARWHHARVEAGAVVVDAQRDVVLAARERNGYVPSVSVEHGVRDRLLRDAVQPALDGRRQRRRVGFRVRDDGDVEVGALAACFGGNVLECRAQGAALERGFTEIED